MYCPRCRAEYQEGFTRCSDCDLVLVDECPPEPELEYVDMVTVFEGDSSSASVIATTLTRAGIESWIKNEGIQGVFPNLGPAEVRVRLQKKESALNAIGTAAQDAASPNKDSV